MQLLTDLASFLSNPPGNLVYILAVAFTLIGSLQGAISQWRSTGYPQAQRLTFGLGLLLAIQVVLFLFSGLMEQNVLQGRELLPVFDRAAMLLSIIWIIWLWAFPETSRAGDAATALMSLLVLAACGFGAVAYSSAAPTIGTFNSSSQVFYWNLGGILILLLGMGLLILRKPVSWGTGLAMLGLMLAGSVWNIFQPADSGDFSGIIRFFMLASYPLLLSLPTRFSGVRSTPAPRKILPALEPSVHKATPAVESKNEKIRERRRYSSDPKTLQSLLTLAAQTEPAKVDQYIARAIAQALLVDLCFLIYIGDDRNSLVLGSGYDLIREESLESGFLNKDRMPALADAIFHGRPLKMPSSNTSPDVKGLSELLGLPDPGNLLNVPVTSEKGILGSVLLLSPYSKRVWNADDQAILTNTVTSILPIIERSRKTAEDGNLLERAQSASGELVQQAQNLKINNEKLAAQLEELKKQLALAVAEAARQKTLAEKTAGVAASQKALVDKASQGAVEEAQTASRNAIAELQAVSASKTQLENEMRQTLAEMARLQNQLGESNSKILALETQKTGKISTDQSEVIASISQELRQPMSSIIGYADLLLGESVGILGALQRKFIERIRTSTERIGSLVDDLIQIGTIETGLMAVKTEPVDLNLIIDNAMAYTASQMREKNITLRIDIPENLKPIDADRDALQQILIHLLQNAGAATPVEGSVALRVRMEEVNAGEQIMIQVTDSGGGIPAEDLPRVFSRLYRAENALIQGVGDTGVGLSIAKALTDAQGGSIRVDTKMGSGSTFTVSLPVKSPLPGQVPQEV